MLRFFEPEVESPWPFSTTSSYEPRVHGSNEPWQPLSSNAFSELEVLFNGGFFANPINGLQTQDFYMDSLSCSPVISFDAPGSRTSIRSSNQHPNITVHATRRAEGLEEIPTPEPKRLKMTPTENPRRRPEESVMPQKLGKPVKAPMRRSQKLGDKITSLQQLVSPFGKTDTTSVLHEASIYIKTLHQQIQMLTNPFVGNKPSSHEILYGGQGIGLKERGLCLVPVSATVINLRNQYLDRGCIYAD